MSANARSNEIRLTRVYDAPVRVVWDAWTVLEQVEKWWGPRGFTLTTHSKELRPGGTWRYTMHGPDGTDYPNIATYHVVEREKKLVYDHGATDETPPLFRVTVTFTETAGKTTMEMVMALPTPEAAAETAKFIKLAGGNSTWDRLAEHVHEATRAAMTFVVQRSFGAPPERVFQAWTNPDELARWLPPAGSTMRFRRAEIAVGKSTFFEITGPHGTMYVHAEYLALEAPRRIVYVQQFVDANERPTAAPGTDAWPQTLRNTVSFAEEGAGRTRVTVVTEAHGDASPTELAAFVKERAGMTRGWTGSFDVLEERLGG